jgi:glutamine synthetase
MTQVDTATSPSAIKEELRQAGVEYFFGAYVDIHGIAKGKAVPIDHFEDAVGGSELFTPGALEGMGDLGPHEDECAAIPDLSGLCVLPWDRRYAFAPANLTFKGEIYSHDSRAVLQRQLKAAKELGYTMNMGIEPEIYVLREEDGGIRPFIAEDTLQEPTRAYDVEFTMLADEFLSPMVKYMDELEWSVFSFDHEGGHGQYEFDFNYTDALAMADRMLVFRMMAKAVARSMSCFVSFMPKPFVDSFASGAHMNLSLADESGANVFDSGENGSRRPAGYSKAAMQFAAGVLHHADAITALACSTVNSYKRLVPHGFMREMTWAPVYAQYGDNNRTLMCRLPMNRKVVEIRTVDSASNFYLAAAFALACGLEGIREGLDPGEPVNVDTYQVMEDPARRDSLRRLPRNLGEAVDAFERDELASDVLGVDFHRTYVEYKRREWELYNTVVTEWERKQYLRLW